MRNSLVQIVFALLMLILGGAIEEFLPPVLNVGWPVLLVVAQYVASKRSLAHAVIFAVAAGAFEDSLSSLPPLTSVSFFLFVALLMLRADIPRVAILLTYPLYQLWLHLWLPELAGSIFVRILVACPIGVATAYATVAFLLWSERKVALDGAN